MFKCSDCADTGLKADGTPCHCREHMPIEIPAIVEIPAVYQSAEFSGSLVPCRLPPQYGAMLESILHDIKRKGSYTANLLICSPPNSGKTIFAYSIYRSQYLKGLPMPDIIDLVEARELIMSNSYDEEVQGRKDKFIRAPIAVIKIPLDLPNKFAETMSMIIERRVRRNGITIFLYGGAIYDLYNQDKYGSLKNIVRDGSYNSLQVLSYNYPKESERIINEP